MLGALDVGEHVDVVLAWAREHLAELQVAETIRNDVTEGVDKQQREFLLRQQLSAIRKELGEGDDDVVGEYRTKLETLEAADSAKNFIAKEIDRLERTSAQSPEQGWIRTWLDRVFELPWGVRTDDTIDLGAAQTVLDEDHYGLADVKSRIVEFLAVKKLRAEREVDDEAERSATKRGAGSIITLVGPPGVGKTSLGESIARAMGRKFVRVALGGIRDEAEIRGHRRTYVGSQPGRIVKAITEAGTMNPVVLLDEVDKLGAGAWSGDPTAALLEVLDPAQNHTFRDHYLELDLDLSEVVFIATANVLDTVPAPLLDRMDVVRLDGYTDAEKVFIADRYLLPRQLQRAGLAAGRAGGRRRHRAGGHPRLHREAGVRSLERELGRLARKAAAKIAAGEALPPLDAEHLHDWIGRAKVVDDVPERTELPGVATGLAVTGHGGDVLFIETTGVPRRWRERARPDPHRSARRRHEGVGADRPQLRALARRRADGVDLGVEQAGEDQGRAGATRGESEGASSISGPARMLAMSRSNGARAVISGWSMPSATASSSSPGPWPSLTPLIAALSSVTSTAIVVDVGRDSLGLGPQRHRSEGEQAGAGADVGDVGEPLASPLPAGRAQRGSRRSWRAGRCRRRGRRRSRN